MKKLKMILPMLAFVMAVGLSFGFVDTTVSPENGYIYKDSAWQQVDVMCGTGSQDCRVKFSPNGEVYQVFDADLTTPRSGNSEEAILITP
ncbi:DUF6520 family protein [Gelidibacter pelagius]|uniref:Secreted protein n=1 Tax=Gelidibacter pelagius TaxID=2819985 RepID=A0ABS3SX12_9FLAO|nr:DUF6520 family protein [Gelidibacter pelagius]MBO3100262.1 hypothetical protein [Gelidibacter pelagius]